MPLQKLSWSRSAVERALVILMLFILPGLAACARTSYPASLPLIESRPGWKVTETTYNVLHEETGVEFGFSPLNNPANTAPELFVWITTSRRPGVEVKMELDGIRLRFKGKIFVGEGWRCSIPVRPIAIERLPRFDSSQRGCGLVKFPVATPLIDEEFSLIVAEAIINGKVVNLPEVRFRKGLFSFRGGFN